MNLRRENSEPVDARETYVKTRQAHINKIDSLFGIETNPSVVQDDTLKWKNKTYELKEKVEKIIEEEVTFSEFDDIFNIITKRVSEYLPCNAHTRKELVDYYTSITLTTWKFLGVDYTQENEADIINMYNKLLPPEPTQKHYNPNVMISTLHSKINSTKSLLQAKKTGEKAAIYTAGSVPLIPFSTN